MLLLDVTFVHDWWMILLYMTGERYCNTSLIYDLAIYCWWIILLYISSEWSRKYCWWMFLQCIAGKGSCISWMLNDPAIRDWWMTCYTLLVNDPSIHDWWMILLYFTGEWSCFTSLVNDPAIPCWWMVLLYITGKWSCCIWLINDPAVIGWWMILLNLCGWWSCMYIIGEWFYDAFVVDDPVGNDPGVCAGGGNDPRSDREQRAKQPEDHYRPQQGGSAAASRQVSLIHSSYIQYITYHPTE
jgi:hypothetical protein